MKQPRAAAWRDLVDGALAHIVVIASYSALALWWYLPRPGYWVDRVAYAGGTGFDDLGNADFYLNLWALAWGAKALLAHPLTVFSAPAFYPAPYSLAFSEHLLGYAPLFAPTFLLTQNPVLALNVMAWLTYPLSAYFTFLLARRALSLYPAFFAGFLFAFCLGRYLSPPHYHTLGVQYLPLVVLGLEASFRQGRPRDVLLLSVALTLQALSSVYFLYAVFFMCLSLVPLFIVWNRYVRDIVSHTFATILAFAISSVVVALVMIPYLRLRSYGLVPSYDSQQTSLGLIPLFSRIALVDYLTKYSLGWAGYALAVVGLISRVPNSDRQLWRFRSLSLILVVTGCLASFGPAIQLYGFEIPSPYAILYEWIPGLATVRLPVRFAVVAQLGLALLAGVGVERICRKVTSPGLSFAIGVLLLAAVLWSYLPFPELATRTVTTRRDLDPAYRWLSAHGDGGALLELPRDSSFAGRARRVYLSTFHGLPVLEGYAANGPRNVAYFHWVALRLPAPAALQELVDLVDVRWILLSVDELSSVKIDEWKAATAGLRLVQSWDDRLLFEVTLGPRNNRRGHLFDPAETIDGTRIKAVNECAGSLKFVGWTSAPSAPGTDMRAAIELVNDSKEAWPGFSFLPQGLFEITATIYDEAGYEAVPTWIIPLNADVLPQGRVTSYVKATAPSRAGRFTLAVRVVQHGVNHRVPCLPALSVPFVLGGDREGATSKPGTNLDRWGESYVVAPPSFGARGPA